MVLSLTPRCWHPLLTQRSIGEERGDCVRHLIFRLPKILRQPGECMPRGDYLLRAGDNAHISASS
jgi:hypothetical protein